MNRNQSTFEIQPSHETEPSTESPPASLRSSIGDRPGETQPVWELRDALLLNAPVACRNAAQRAGKRRDRGAVPLLCDLLRPPRGWKMRLRQQRWAAARVAAVNALRQIGLDRVTVTVVAHALLDPAPAVQQAAVEAVVEFGPDALPALEAALNISGDWTFSGMQHLVSVFGRLQTPAAVPALVSVILGFQPAPPARWDRALLTSFRLLCGGVPLAAILTLVFTGDFPLALAVLLMLTLLGVFFWMLAALFCIIPLRAMREARERNAIAMQAAEYLRLVGDKAYLPTIVEGAFGYNRMSPHPARRALRYLLPLLTAEDFDRLPFGTRSQLMHALGRYDAEMNFALLLAMEWIGTGQATAKVARMAARGTPSTLRAEAARILPILQARQQQEQAPATLLRASQPATPSGQLLRPGLPASATPTEQLLRPGNAD